MGYQAQLILGDAWAHGAPQSCSRVFLYFAAPGYKLPDAPLMSHSHYPGVKPDKRGRTANSEHFLERVFHPTAFNYVSAAEATTDLSPIDDGKADSAIAFPTAVPARASPRPCATRSRLSSSAPSAWGSVRHGTTVIQ
jgi:DNA (cytosine-5)-methyltransferase 1